MSNPPSPVRAVPASLPADPTGAARRLARLLGYLDADPENTRLRGDVFDAALAAGHFDVAGNQTTWVLSRTPADFGWRHRLALLDMAQGNHAEAAILLRSLIGEGQSDPILVYNLAYAEYLQADFGSAAACLQPWDDARFAAMPEALTLLLRCLHSQGALDDGTALFRRLAEHAASADSFGVAALIALDAGNVNLAKEWAGRALARDAGQREALVALGTAMVGERDAVSALRHLDAAFERTPGDGRTLSARGMAQLLVGDYQASRVSFAEATRRMPGHVGTWHGLGWCAIFAREPAAALAAFESALALDRNFGESHGGIAVAQAMKGMNEQARESIRRAIKLDPATLSARYAEAVLAGELEDPVKFARRARAVLSQRRDAEGLSLSDVVFGRRTNTGPTGTA